MNLDRRRLTLLAVPIGLLLVALVAFGVDATLHRGRVARGVQVADLPVGGMTAEELRVALATWEDARATAPIPVLIDGRPTEVLPADLGFDVDEDAVVDAALAVGRDPHPVRRFLRWTRALFGGTDTIEPLARLDEVQLEATLAFWDAEIVAQPPFDGAIEVVDTVPVPRYPTPGRIVDRGQARDLLLASALALPHPGVDLPIATVPPRLDAADVDATLAEARVLLAGPITLRRVDPAVEVTFTVDDLVRAFRSEVVVHSDPSLSVGFDPTIVDEILMPLAAELESPPQDARIEIDEDDQVTIVPSRPGTVIDPGETARALVVAAHHPDRIGVLPFEEGAQPAFTTEDATALGIKGKVSEFTTRHPCCQPRVTNIHLFADIVDGAIVLPGESFSLNGYVGERTEERGFVPAPTIIRGKIVDTVGGGVSQFATTFYNAVFWGGYEDVTHQPHSYYFSRYPEGIEATISWPAPDLVFRNDTDAAVLVKTEYTDTSITVKFFGDNGGRTVEGRVSDRFDWTDPATEWIPNPELAPGEQNVITEGARGWSVRVTRIITFPDGTQKEERWLVRYRARPWEIEVHPCMIPEGEEGYTGETCPTTTTTAPTSSTSSTTTTTP